MNKFAVGDIIKYEILTGTILSEEKVHSTTENGFLICWCYEPIWPNSCGVNSVSFIENSCEIVSKIFRTEI